MGVDSVLWEDGQFLFPHHFQSLESQFRGHLHRCEEWSSPYYYGLHKLEFSLTALSNWSVQLERCHMRLRDGTKLRFPEDCHLSAAAIPRNMLSKADARLKVYVGIPVLKKGHGNSVAVAGDVGSRFVRYEEEVEDENEAGNPQTVQFRKLNARILFGEEAIRGFDALPIAQLRMGAKAEAPPEIDDVYVPPLLCKEAWQPLEAFFSSVTNYLGAISDQLARTMIDRGVAFASGHRDDMERILKLHAVNTTLGSLSPLVLARGIHPFTVYQELCRAVGQVAIFRSAPMMPEFPVYDHDDPHPSFQRLRELLRIDGSDPVYEIVPFSAQGLQMTVRMKRTWLDPDWSFYVGVNSQLPNSKVNARMTSARDLDMKAGSCEEVDKIFKDGRSGVRLIPVADPPRVFPLHNWHYFRVDRDGDWLSVEKTLNFGLRFNETKVKRRIDGEDRIDVIDIDGSQTTLAFSLFAIQSKKI